MRTSGSPVLVGAYDASTGITLPDGELVAMGPYITTQAHVLRLIVQSVLKLRSYSPGIGEGDNVQFVTTLTSERRISPMSRPWPRSIMVARFKHG